jgi:hypothetical protein
LIVINKRKNRRVVISGFIINAHQKIMMSLYGNFESIANPGFGKMEI